MAAKPVTLKDLSQKLNLTQTTISKALRDHPDISELTKKKIIGLAEELGYVPNFLASRLSSRKSRIIGLVLPQVANSFFGSITENIYRIAEEYNYEVILSITQESSELERKHLQRLLSMKVDGIIISIAKNSIDYEIYKSFMGRDIPVIFIDRIPLLDNINSVTSDDYRGALNAVEYAIKIGYKRIAHFAGTQQLNTGRERLAGYIAAMTRYNMKISDNWIVRCGYDEEDGYRSLMQLANKNELPEIIFAVTYPVALGIYKAAEELNLRIPEDVDVFCFGNTGVQEFLSPPLSCVDQSSEEMSKSAFRLLLKNMQENAPEKLKVDTNLVLRGTLRYCREFKNVNVQKRKMA